MRFRCPSVLLLLLLARASARVCHDLGDDKIKGVCHKGRCPSGVNEIAGAVGNDKDGEYGGCPTGHFCCDMKAGPEDDSDMPQVNAKRARCYLPLSALCDQVHKNEFNAERNPECVHLTDRLKQKLTTLPTCEAVMKSTGYIVILTDPEDPIATGGLARWDRIYRPLQLREFAVSFGLPESHIITLSTDALTKPLCMSAMHLAPNTAVTDTLKACHPFTIEGAEANFDKLQEVVLGLPEGASVFVMIEAHGGYKLKSGDRFRITGQPQVLLDPSVNHGYIADGCLSMAHSVLKKAQLDSHYKWCKADFLKFVAKVQARSTKMVLWTGACYGSSLYNFEFPYLSTHKEDDPRNREPSKHKSSDGVLFVGMKDNRPSKSAQERVVFDQLIKSFTHKSIREAVEKVKTKEKKAKGDDESNRVPFRGGTARKFNIDDGNRVNAFGDEKLYDQDLGVILLN